MKRKIKKVLVYIYATFLVVFGLLLSFIVLLITLSAEKHGKFLDVVYKYSRIDDAHKWVNK
jgi:hypothetical protein